MNARDGIRAKLRSIAGIPPYSPFDAVIDSYIDLIVDEVCRVAGTGTPTPADWNDAIGRFVPGIGLHPMAGEDFSDLNRLLFQLRIARPSGGGGGSGGNQK